MIEFAEDAEDCAGATLRAMGFKTEKIRETAKGRTPDFAASRGSEHVLVEVKTTSPRLNLQSFRQGMVGFFYSRWGDGIRRIRSSLGLCEAQFNNSDHTIQDG